MSLGNAKWHMRTDFSHIEQVARTAAKKNKDGTEETMRPPTLGDAKKWGFLPSVTSIIHGTLAPNRRLMEYIIGAAIEACIKTPFPAIPEGKFAETLEQYKRDVIIASEDYKNQTAKRGKELHKIVNRYILQHEDQPDDPVGKTIINHLKEFVSSKGIIELTGEIQMGSVELGYTGTPDIVGNMPDGALVILDLKTTDAYDKAGKPKFKGFSDLYDAWALQAGAYSILHGDKPNTKFWQMIADRNSGAVIFVEYEGDQLQTFSRAFMGLFTAWKAINNYSPETFNKENK